MKTRKTTLPLLSALSVFWAVLVQAGSFINLDFDDGVYSPDGRWVTLPGWTVSYDGTVDLERNPLSASRIQMLPTAETGINQFGPTLAVAPGPQDESSCLPRDFPGIFRAECMPRL